MTTSPEAPAYTQSSDLLLFTMPTLNSYMKLGHSAFCLCSAAKPAQLPLPMSLYPTDSWSSVKKMGAILDAPFLLNWTCSRDKTCSKV